MSQVCPRPKILSHSSMNTSKCWNGHVLQAQYSSIAVKWEASFIDCYKLFKSSTNLSLSNFATFRQQPFTKKPHEFIKVALNTSQHVNQCTDCQVMSSQVSSVRESVLTCWFPLAGSGPARLNGVHLPWKCASAHVANNPIVCAVLSVACMSSHLRVRPCAGWVGMARSGRSSRSAMTPWCLQ